jgi:putative transposase
LITTAENLGNTVGKKDACEALQVSRATFYRHLKPDMPCQTKRPGPPLALSDPERHMVINTLHSDRFCDLAPYQVYAQLLDDGEYLCGISTMYRILHGIHGDVKERRRQVARRHHVKPELLATGPNQVWSWDITKLKGPVKWTYFYLYVILDIFSRYVVGWMIASREHGSLAKNLIEDSCMKQNIQTEQLIVHSDRGASMKSKAVAGLQNHSIDPM